MAYELSGKLEEARRWINKGSELNPELRLGTELRDVRILEAKIGDGK
ncbi:MAG: hypothetical protein AAGB46_13825 [Verrucomicrobiota bacterium]